MKKNPLSKKQYILFNKPWGVLSQFTTPQEESHLTLSEFNLPKDVYAVGRLDKDSEGLLLLSNDGKFIKTFLDNHPRVYWVQVEGIPNPDTIKKLSMGVNLKDGKTKPCQVSIINKQDLIPPRNPPIRERKSIPTTWLEMTLFEGKNRQVRRMTASIGHPTLRLIRVGLGKITFEWFEKIPCGDWVEFKIQDIL